MCVTKGLCGLECLAKARQLLLLLTAWVGFCMREFAAAGKMDEQQREFSRGWGECYLGVL